MEEIHRHIQDTTVTYLMCKETPIFDWIICTLWNSRSVFLLLHWTALKLSISLSPNFKYISISF